MQQNKLHTQCTLHKTTVFVTAYPSSNTLGTPQLVSFVAQLKHQARWQHVSALQLLQHCLASASQLALLLVIISTG